MEFVENEGRFEIKTDIPTGKRVVVHSHVINNWPVLPTKYSRLSCSIFLERILNEKNKEGSSFVMDVTIRRQIMAASNPINIGGNDEVEALPTVPMCTCLEHDRLQHRYDSWKLIAWVVFGRIQAPCIAIAER